MAKPVGSASRHTFSQAINSEIPSLVSCTLAEGDLHGLGAILTALVGYSGKVSKRWWIGLERS